MEALSLTEPCDVMLMTLPSIAIVPASAMAAGDVLENGCASAVPDTVTLTGTVTAKFHVPSALAVAAPTAIPD